MRVFSVSLIFFFTNFAKANNTILWTNWDVDFTVVAHGRLEPTSIEEVQDAVRKAIESGGRIKAVGSGHSSCPLVSFGPRTSRGGSDFLLSLDRMPKGIASRDDSTKTVEVWAGTTLHELNSLLWDARYALPTTPAIDLQTLAGAISSCSHGSSAKRGSMSSYVVGMTLVDGNGEVMTVEEDDPDLGGYRCGLGLLGIMVKVKLRVVERFELQGASTTRTAAEVLKDFEEEFYQADFVDIKIDNNVNSAIIHTLNVPNRTSSKNEIAPEDRSYVQLASGMAWLSPFSEGEFYVPGQKMAAAYAALSRLIARRNLGGVGFFFRVVKPEDANVWLSPATSVIAPPLKKTGFKEEVNTLIVIETYEEGWGYQSVPGYKPAVEAILLDYGGRSHWAKTHNHVARDWRTLEEYFPRVGDFLRLRQRCDPHGVFMNDWLQRELLVDEFEASGGGK